MQSNEILGVVDSVSTEKGLDKDVIFKAIEIAIASASQRHFHEDADLYVKIDRETGEYSTHRNWICLLYTSPSPRDQRGSRMPSSA